MPASPSSSNEGAGRRGTTRSSNGERDAQGQIKQRLVVHRHQSLPPAHLLGRYLGQQVATHGALVVGGGPLALAGDRGGDEAQRVELRM